MAILSTAKIVGMLSSAKKTGRQVMNAAGEWVAEVVEDFMSGFAGYGWKIWEYVKGKWMLEIDSIRVREQFIVFEMLVSKMRAIIGSLGISQACGKIATVTLSEDGTEYLITLEDETMSFVTHDFMRCQTYSGTKQTFYHVEISSVVDDVIHVPVMEFDKDEEGIVVNPPEVGNDIVQFGNSVNKNRQSAIYIHADESGQPAIDIMFDIDSKDWSGKVKTRLGGDIPGGDGARGFYCENGMIKGTDTSEHTVYCIYPDGSAEFGDGSAKFNADKSGFIAGGAISWAWDASKNQFITSFKNVVIKWEDLDDEAKDNLKGEPGKDGVDGKDGKDGADGIDGQDGTSIIWQGSFASHPSNPQNGWAYKNTTDGKSYVYQDGTWYQMTIDGVDGANGKDGSDGLSVVWKGDLSAPPANPVKNWVYRDTDNGRVYIYNGTAWVLMVADGNDGSDGTDGNDGLSVFITYHDGESQPATPTGDGTSGGWHTNTTSAVVWMSQKVSESASSGSWGSPIKIKGDKGEPGLPGSDADVPDWVKDWDTGKVQIGDKYMISPALFTGKNTGTAGAPMLTGILLGDKCITIDGEIKSGFYCLKNNEIVFSIDANTANITTIGDVIANAIKATGLNINDKFVVGKNGEIAASNCIFDSIYAEGFICSKFSTSLDIDKQGNPKTMNIIVNEGSSLNFTLPVDDKYIGSVITIYLNRSLALGELMKIDGYITVCGELVVNLIKNKGTILRLMATHKVNNDLYWEVINFNSKKFSIALLPVTSGGSIRFLLDRSTAAAPDVTLTAGGTLQDVTNYWNTI